MISSGATRTVRTGFLTSCSSRSTPKEAPRDALVEPQPQTGCGPLRPPRGDHRSAPAAACRDRRRSSAASSPVRASAIRLREVESSPWAPRRPATAQLFDAPFRSMSAAHSAPEAGCESRPRGDWKPVRTPGRRPRLVRGRRAVSIEAQDFSAGRRQRRRPSVFGRHRRRTRHTGRPSGPTPSDAAGRSRAAGIPIQEHHALTQLLVNLPAAMDMEPLTLARGPATV